ncbi:hypothetical protein QTP88_026562 [Uroleucon formosanum]
MFSQIDLILNPKEKLFRWSNENIAAATSLRSVGLSTLRKWAAKFSVEKGMLTDVLALIKKKEKHKCNRNIKENVKLATQVFSNRLAEALKYCEYFPTDVQADITDDALTPVMSDLRGNTEDIEESNSELLDNYDIHLLMEVHEMSEIEKECIEYITGSPPEQPSSYRPISLLPVLGKILEKVILKRITTIAQLNNSIPNFQLVSVLFMPQPINFTVYWTPSQQHSKPKNTVLESF